MEGIQTRGAKRSGKEAELPERPVEEQSTPGAAWVDSSGAPVTKDKEKLVQAAGLDDLSKPEPAPLQQQQQQQTSMPGVAQPMEIVISPSESQESRQRIQVETPRATSTKEESKEAFASLVRATCSSRSYPY
jgi:hypothetical protein